MREQFVPYSPTKASLTMIDICNSIIEEYQGDGMRLTLRQLYYQLVSRDIISNNDRAYSNLGNLISKARLGGLVDWEAIEDRVRKPAIPAEWDNVEQLVSDALLTYRLPRLQGQEAYVELWVEKDALSGVLAPIARNYHVPLMVNRGYSSQSAMYEAAKRFQDREMQLGCAFSVLFYLGDLDPSGEDMVRDIQDRLVLFGCEDLQVEKVALTIEQVEEHNPPPNPAKLKDSRAAKFIEKYGRSSWEVDALSPPILRGLIESSLEGVLDTDRIGTIREQEEADKGQLRRIIGSAP